MSDEPISPASGIDQQIAVLGGGTPREQKAAREALVAHGPAALPALTGAYRTSSGPVRYELIRVVAELQSAAAAPLLVEAVSGSDEDARFIAAEGLVGLEAEALDPLLAALAADPANAVLREGALQVFAELALSELGDTLAPVVDALSADRGEPAIVHACKAAVRALAAWRAEAA